MLILPTLPNTVSVITVVVDEARLVRRALVAIALAGAATLAACGGGGETTSPLSAQEYAAKLDSLCKTRDGQLEQVSDGQPQQVGAIYDEFEHGVSELTPPADLADAQQQLIEMLGKRPADSSDPEAYMQYYGQLDTTYERLGAQGCRKQSSGMSIGAVPAGSQS